MEAATLLRTQGFSARALGIGVARGGQKGHAPQFFENIVILCCKRRFSKQNSVIRLTSNILAPQKFLGWLRHRF